MLFEKLALIAQKPRRRIIGLMSGTSMDGLDIALCEISGYGQRTKVSVLNFVTKAYSSQTRELIQSVFCKKTVELDQLCLLNAWIGSLHAQLVLEALEEWKVDRGTVDLVASHGQTVYHAPERFHGRGGVLSGVSATLQIGDGDHVAVKTGIVTVCDFRQKHVAGGGEGAPLAPYGDWVLFSKEGENRILLNIGGIANFTLLARMDGAGGGGATFSSDTGPGNTLIDLIVTKYRLNEDGFDRGGNIAKSGNVSETLLEEMLAHEFFKGGLPKTTGQEVFNWDFIEDAKIGSGNEGMDANDLVATLTSLTAISLADAVKAGVGIREARPPFTVFVSGGGANNTALMGELANRMPGPEYRFTRFEELGIAGDAKEAVIFACLANETVCGGKDYGESCPQPRITMGKICFPD